MSLYLHFCPLQCGFPVAQHAHFCNLLRWYDYIHHVADKGNIFPAATFSKPNFVPPKPASPQLKENAASKAVAPAAAAPEAATPAAAAAATEGLSKAAAKKAEKKAAKVAAKAAAKGSSVSAPETPAASAVPVPTNAPAASTATSAPAAPAAAATDDLKVDLLDLKVGTIVKVGAHPNADSLYVEEIDLGEEAPRQIVSGLRKFVTEEDMQGRRVVVVCNLKPAKMRDVMSYGMVLCASNEDHTVVQPVTPPEGVANGERIKFEGFDGEPEALLNPRKKQFEKIAPFLITNAGEN